MTAVPTTDWRALTRDAALASHRLVGWIFWDPWGTRRYAELGVPDGAGWYFATRGAPLAAAGDDAVVATFGSINPLFIQVSLDLCRQHTTFERAMAVRDEAVLHGLPELVPDVCGPLAELAEPLWAAADTLPLDGRALFAAHLRHRREDEPLLSAWLALNCIREWRGDTHWALHVAEGIDGQAAMLLDAAWRGHDDDWLPRSRGADDALLERARAALDARGLLTGGRVNEEGIAWRQALEDRLDDLCTPGWQALGEARTRRLVELVAPHVDTLIGRIDQTAGDRWMPAARPRPDRSVPS
ncbi:MAG: SCO6745 family protein [Acidimicrobiia bacterium]